MLMYKIMGFVTAFPNMHIMEEITTKILEEKQASNRNTRSSTVTEGIHMSLQSTGGPVRWLGR